MEPLPARRRTPTVTRPWLCGLLLTGFVGFAAGCTRKAPTEGDATGRVQGVALAAPAPTPGLFDGTCVRDAPGCKKDHEVAVLAGGCFWGMQEILRGVDGVVHTEVGYAGGQLPDPTYNDVKTGKTGHAEAVRVVFDPKRLSYDRLLEHWFYRMHDPTTQNRQGNDVGSQYRSAIFVLSKKQEEIARAVTARVDSSGKWSSPIVTEITPAGPFTSAEDDHQDYLQKNPGGYTCHYMRD